MWPIPNRNPSFLNEHTEWSFGWPPYKLMACSQKIGNFPKQGRGAKKKFLKLLGSTIARCLAITPDDSFICVFVCLSACLIFVCLFVTVLACMAMFVAVE